MFYELIRTMQCGQFHGRRSTNEMASSIQFKILKIFLAFLALVVGIFLLALNSPVYLFRCFVRKIAPNCRPDLGDMLTSGSTIFAIDDMHGKTKCNVVVGFELDGILKLGQLQKLFYNNVICATVAGGRTTPNCGLPRLKFPELRQYIEPWMGFLFFKEDTNFDLNRHIILHNSYYSDSQTPSPIDLDELKVIFLNKSWERRKPLWELVLADHDDRGKNGRSYMFLRFHHSLGDGFAFLNVVAALCGSQILGEKMPRPASLPPPRRSLTSKIVFPFRLAYDFVGTQLLSYKMNKSWPMRPVRLHDEKSLVSTGKFFPLDRVKRIKNHFGISFTSVIFAAYAGVLRDKMITDKIGTRSGDDEDYSLPDYAICFSVLPVLSHSSQLRNEMAGSHVLLPVGEKDALRRLQYCEKAYQRIKTSTMAVLHGLTVQMLGLHFTSVLRPIMSCVTCPTAISNFPTGPSYVSIGGTRLTGVTFGAGLQRGQTGLALAIVSYGENMCISVVGDHNVVGRDELVRLSDGVVDHIDKLHDLIK